MKPFIIVVTGPPGSGKTTLAHALGARIHCPALCRDEFKEGYLHSLGKAHSTLGNDTNRELYTIFFETVEFVVAKGVSLVIEAAFQHALWEPKLRHLAQFARIALVICTVPPELARARCVERAAIDSSREYFHGDTSGYLVSEHRPVYEPPRLALPTLQVDTSAGYSPSLEYIVAFAITNQPTS